MRVTEQIGHNFNLNSDSARGPLSQAHPVASGMGLSAFSEPLLLDMEGAARFIGISKAALYELCRQRSQCKPPVVKLGRRLMFRASSLQAWIESLEQAR